MSAEDQTNHLGAHLHGRSFAEIAAVLMNVPTLDQVRATGGPAAKPVDESDSQLDGAPDKGEASKVKPLPPPSLPAVSALISTHDVGATAPANLLSMDTVQPTYAAMEQDCAEIDTLCQQTSSPPPPAGMAWRLALIAILSLTVVAALFATLFGSQMLG
jgi:hypothetical protein